MRPAQGAILWAKADLNGDGIQEVITALNGSNAYGRGAVFVIHKEGDSYSVDRTDQPAQPYLLDTRLYAVTDLTGDGKPEIVWSTAELPNSYIFVSNWQLGRFDQLPGNIQMMRMVDLKVEGKDLFVRGTCQGCNDQGESRWRVRLHRYRLVDGAFRLIEEQLQPFPEPKK